MENHNNGITIARWFLHLSFTVCPYSNEYSDWPKAGGIYIFSGLPNPDNLQGTNPAYVGETSNFQVRIPNHPRWKLAHDLHNATHVHYMIVEDPLLCKSLEKYLIQSLRPPLNKKHL